MKDSACFRVLATLLWLVVLQTSAGWAQAEPRSPQWDDGRSAARHLELGLLGPSGTVDVMVSQSSDDAEERLDTHQVYTKSDDLELGTDQGPSGALNMMVGIRFAGIGIPQGVTITSAYIEFAASEVQEGATSVTILGEASDSAQTYKGDDFEISTRTPAAASVPWNAIPAWSTPGAKYKTPELKAIVQQIVNRAGWNPSNAMAFMFAGSGRRTAWSWDGSSMLAPRLVINYEGQVQCTTLTRLSNPPGAGQIAVDPPPNCGATQYYQGTPVQLTASPTGTDYYFGNWSGGASGLSNPTTVVMNADQAVTANFLQGTCYTLTMNVQPVADPTAGEIRPDPTPNCGDGTKAGKYQSGTLVMVDAVARGGWTFTGWSGALTGADKPQPLLMDASKTVTATFTATCRRIKMTIDPPTGGIVQYNPPADCPPGSDYWQPDTVVQLLAVPVAGYSFVKWSGDVAGNETLDNPTTVVMDASKSVTAGFVQGSCYALDVAVSPGGSGSTSPVPPPNCAGGRYLPGTTIELTAHASECSTFSHWTGDASGDDNPTTVSMDADKSVTANFDSLPPPSAPELSSPTDGSSSCNRRPQFQWQQVAGAEQYRIRISHGDTSSTVIQTDVEETSYTPSTDLAPGTYFWLVRAYDGCGWSSWSAEWWFTILSPPPAPALTLPADGTSSCDPTPGLQWQPVAGATEYQVRITDGDPSSIVMETELEGTRYTPASALEPGSYFWRVRARDDCGWGNWSETWCFAVLAPPVVPVLTNPPHGSSIYETQPIFAWSAAQGASHYHLQVDDQASFGSPVVDREQPGTSYQPADPLLPGTYYWRVRAANDCGISAWSEAYSLNVLPVPEQVEAYLPLVRRVAP